MSGGPWAGNKTSNEYADMIPQDFYRDCPKAVLAAIAVSFAMMINGEDEKDGIGGQLAREWATLHENGIVPQALPGYLRKAETDPED